MRLKIKNYQSLRDVTIDVKGLTVITGRSNIGKSAIIRSLIAAITNKKGNSFISKGSDLTDISIEQGENSIRWMKGAKTTEYQINGVLNKKAGRSHPKEEIADALGIFPVTAQEKLYYPQIHRQFDLPFVVGESSPTVTAELLASSKHNQILTTAIKLAQKDLTKKSTEIEFLEGQVRSTKALLQGALDLKEGVVKAKTTVLQANQDHEAVVKNVSNLELCLRKFREVSHVVKVCESLPPVFSLKPPSDSRVIPLSLLFDRWSTAKRTAEILTTVVKPVFPEVDWSRYTKLKQLQAQHKTARSTLDIAVISPCATVDEWKAQVKRVAAIQTVRDRHQSLVREISGLATALKEVDDALEVVNQKIKSLLLEVGLCPLCKSPISKDECLQNVA